jgi:hypothetical protein
MFSQSTVDPRIERAFPVLGKLNIRIQEMAEVNEFESWADNIIQEELEPATRRQVQDLVELLGRDSEPMPVGADASSAIGELADIIEDERLNSELRQAAAADPDNDARPVIIGWMEQHRDNPVYDEVLNKLENSSPDMQAPPANTPPPPPPAAKSDMKKSEPMPELQEADELGRILQLIGRK